MACVSSTALICFDLPNGAVLLGGVRSVSPRFSVPRLVAMIRVALPLGVVTMLISLTLNIPRYFLEHYGGSRDLGIFVGLAYVVTASITVIGAIGRAAMPRLANLHAAGQMLAFRRLVRVLVLCGLAIGAAGLLVALVAGVPLLRFLYTAEYAAHAPAFAVVMLAAGIGHAASLLGYAVTAGRRFSEQIPLWFVVAASTSVSSAMLIPLFGVTGAAWALVASAAVQLASYGLLYAKLVVRTPCGGAP
jgi:O-antigen/teichoic acid export membrane protein